MAVYTEVSDDALAEFLAEYDLGRMVAFRGIAEGVENSNYQLRTTTGDFILTLYEKRVDPAELPWFLGLMEHLCRRGITCPQPVHGRDGESLRHLAGRPACITTFLPGVWPRRVRVAHCAPVGAALGALHLAGADYPPERPNALGPGGWQPLLDRCLPRADEVQPGLGAQLSTALAGILAHWPAGLPRGHIHADLFPDNVFFLDHSLSGLIDFYFAATDLYAYDLAVCLNAWCFEPDLSFNVTKARAMLRAYDAVRPLSAAERGALPVLCQGAAILRYKGTERELTGGELTTTNNRMELTAAAAALETLKRPCQVIVHTDSEYVRNGITKWSTGWVRKGWKSASGDPVKNMDLWRRLLDAAKPHQVEWRWVRGHNGDIMNERADVLATRAREGL